MKYSKVLFLFSCISFAANAQDNAQKQRLTEVTQNFMALYNTGDSLRYRVFLEPITQNPAQLNQWLTGYKNAFNFIGKVDVRKTAVLSAVKAEVWAQDQHYDAWWKFTIHTDSLQKFQRRTVEPAGFTESFLKTGKLTTIELSEEIDQYIITKLSKDFAGNVFVARNHSIVYSKSFGNNPEGQPNTYNQQFGLASLGKMFTSISILQLKDKKLLSLNDQVEKFLPDLKNKAVAGTTIRQLLTHTSGMGDFFETPLYHQRKDSLKTSGDFLPFIEADQLLFEPGKGWQYSNTGFMLLGIIIEKVSGLSFEEYVQKNIFQPAGMTHSVAGQGAGGGLSTVNDLYTFSKALLANQLLSQPATEELLQYTVNEKYGYGTEHQKLGVEHIVGHSGGYINQCTELNMYTHNKDIVIILSNSNPPYGHFLSNKIKELLVRR